MQKLSLEQAADYLEQAEVESSHDTGFAVTHFGRSAAGAKFVMTNDCHGRTVLVEEI